MVKPVKPGYQTTEFAFAVVVLAMGFFMANWGSSETQVESGKSLMQWSLAAYVGSRALVKGADHLKS